MKNKKVQRVLCFFLALLCCFSLTDVLAPMQAHALTAELGWLTWAIIAYMAACGITFTAAGGIDALERAVTDAVDTYTEVNEITWVDWVGLLEQAISLQGGGSNNNDDDGDGTPDPNETALKFGSAAAALLAKFVEWLTQNGWDKGSEVSNQVYEKYYYAWLDGVWTKVVCPVLTQVSSKNYCYKYTIDNDATVIPIAAIGSVHNSPGSFAFTDFYNEAGYNVRPIISEKGYLYLYKYNEDGSFKGTFLDWDFSKALSAFNYSVDDISGFMIDFDFKNDECRIFRCYYVMNDGYAIHYSSSYTSSYIYAQALNASATVTVPEELTDISPSEAQVLTINFSEIFGDAAPETIEEATEAIKQTVVDTGTLPVPEVDILEVVEPEPVPTPALTPMPSPTVTDIEGLGLPSLGAALLTRFPFSIPQDIGRIVSVITAERQPPKWEVDFFSPLSDKVAFQGDTSITIDMAEYETVGQISRWASVIGFCIFLVLITKSLIGW